MGQRVAGKVALVVGAGQTEGATVGNGRAAALLMAREGAAVVAVDRDAASAEKTAQEIIDEGGRAPTVRADVASEADIEAVAACVDAYGRLDILHDNVGVAGAAAGDAPVTEIEPETFSGIVAVNLQGMVPTCKHALRIMREQGSGVITDIASNAVLIDYPNVAHRISKAGVLSLPPHVAAANASHGIRANAVLPGLMETPMAMEPRVRQSGASLEQVVAERDARVPLRHPGGTAWDVAHAPLFLASDEAAFNTGPPPVVDGGQSLLTG
ncbi:3-oxoacyl-ACP reductase [Streptomyces sp. NWU339]|uniref:SDR family NAD(P)-dependent oxidoreductase n=1 Tax=Streptomyces sp. NWU339 TaxID=2185284 RepID=UPI000D67937E|nr:SDR family oxidoreductase [Streptomyces sp. NWU339]PWI08931.1 3-oxoacyl-ACP reductase [Streptomyces sp. NWU339]